MTLFCQGSADYTPGAQARHDRGARCQAGGPQRPPCSALTCAVVQASRARTPYARPARCRSVEPTSAAAAGEGAKRARPHPSPRPRRSLERLLLGGAGVDGLRVRLGHHLQHKAAGGRVSARLLCSHRTPTHFFHQRTHTHAVSLLPLLALSRITRPALALIRPWSSSSRMAARARLPLICSNGPGGRGLGQRSMLPTGWLLVLLQLPHCCCFAAAGLQQPRSQHTGLP